jgi:hypothetical protein
MKVGCQGLRGVGRLQFKKKAGDAIAGFMN